MMRLMIELCADRWGIFLLILFDRLKIKLIFSSSFFSLTWKLQTNCFLFLLNFLRLLWHWPTGTNFFSSIIKYLIENVFWSDFPLFFEKKRRKSFFFYSRKSKTRSRIDEQLNNLVRPFETKRIGNTSISIEENTRIFFFFCWCALMNVGGHWR